MLIHTINLSQSSGGSNTVFIYSINDGSSNVVSNTTWAVPSTSGQNSWDVLTDTLLVSNSTTKTYSRTNATATNVAVSRERWIAIPVNI